MYRDSFGSFYLRGYVSILWGIRDHQNEAAKGIGAAPDVTASGVHSAKVFKHVEWANPYPLEYSALRVGFRFLLDLISLSPDDLNY